MRTNENKDSGAERLDIVASVYGNLANIYVEEYYEVPSRSIVSIFFCKNGRRYKHFTYVLGKAKTRVTLTDLGVGDFEADIVQYSEYGESVSGTVGFTINPPAGPHSILIKTKDTIE